MSQSSTASEPAGTDLRKARRARTLKEGKLAFNDHFCTVDCVVRDLSEAGARVMVEDVPVALTDLYLHVPVDGFMVPVKRIWQRDRLWGLMFTGPREPSPLARTQKMSADRSGGERIEEPDTQPAVLDEPAPPPPRRTFGRLR